MDLDWLSLRDKVCVVTGAVGGMGAKICQQLAIHNAKLVLVDLKDEQLSELKKNLETEYHAIIMTATCDTTDQAQVQDLCKKVEEQFGGTDVLINTAGILKFAPLEDLDYDTWKQVIQVNLNGYFLMSQIFGKSMIEKKAGTIIHISTVASMDPETYSGAYSTSKAGVNMLSKQIAAEWGQYGIRRNVIMPCLFKTPMSMSFYSDPAVEAGRKKLTASKRIETVDDIANLTLFLASNRSDYINGAEIPVDGGFHMMMGDQIPKPGGRREYAIKHMK